MVLSLFTLNNKSPPFSFLMVVLGTATLGAGKQKKAAEEKGEQNKTLALTQESATYCGQSAEQDPHALPVLQLLHL